MSGIPSNDTELYNDGYSQGYGSDEVTDPMDAIPEAPYSQEQYQDESDEDEFLGYAESKPKEGLYALFDKVLKLPRTTKVGNVDKEELGTLGISIRECQRVALIGDTFGHRRFAQFFEKQADIITETSMAKKGWFSELFVTAKRFTERSSSMSSPQFIGVQADKPDKRTSPFFGKKR